MDGTKSDAKPAARPSLSEAISRTFSPTAPGRFADRLCALAQAMLATDKVHVMAPNGADILAQATTGTPSEIGLTLARQLTQGDGTTTVTANPPAFAALVALEDGGNAVLTAELPNASPAVLALAQERLALLSQLSYAAFKHPDLSALGQLSAALGDPSKLQSSADALAGFTSANYAAIGLFDGHRVTELAISGQADLGKRGALPRKLKEDMAQTARSGLVTQEKAFADRGGHGPVLHLDGARRNIAFLPLLCAVAAQSPASRPSRTKALIRWTKRAVIITALACLGLVPLPDGIDLPATVISTNERIVTSPLSAPLRTLSVREGDRVTADETVLGRLDTSDIDLELIAAQAAYSAALLERETARGARQAAELRRTELEVERLDARLALLEARRAQTVLTAPISGTVAGAGLDSLEGATIRQGEEILRIVDPASLELRLDIRPDAIDRLTEATKGIFRPDFDPSQRVQATLSEISPAPLGTDPRVPVFRGRAALDDTPVQLRPGMTGVLAADRRWTPVWRIVWTGLRDWVLLRVWI